MFPPSSETQGQIVGRGNVQTGEKKLGKKSHRRADVSPYKLSLCQVTGYDSAALKNCDSPLMANRI